MRSFQVFYILPAAEYFYIVFKLQGSDVLDNNGPVEGGLASKLKFVSFVTKSYAMYRPSNVKHAEHLSPYLKNYLIEKSNIVTGDFFISNNYIEKVRKTNLRIIHISKCSVNCANRRINHLKPTR